MNTTMFTDVSVALTSLSPPTIFAAGLMRSLGAHVVMCAEAPRSEDVDDYLVTTYLRDVPTADMSATDMDLDIEITNQNRPQRASSALTVLTLNDPEGTELNEFARCCLGGATAYTYRPDGMPVYGFGDRYGYLAAIYGLTAALGHVYYQPEETTEIQINLVEMVAALLPYPTVQFEYNGSESTSAQSGPRYVTPTRDGFVVIYAGFDWDCIATLLGPARPMPESNFELIENRFAHADQLGAAFTEWAQEQTTDEVLAAGRQAKVPIARVADPEEIAERFPSTTSRPVHVPFRQSASGPNWQPVESAKSTKTNERGPLSGLRVLDFTQVWSGPYATRILAELGADVVKVESPARPDWLRKLGPLTRYPNFEPGEDFENRNAWFNTQNRGKKALSVNFKDPKGRDLMYELAAVADVVISNTRPGVMERLALDSDGYWKAGSCNVIQMPGFDSTSPEAADMALGAQYDAFSSGAFFMGDSQAPLLTGFALGDPVAGAFGALAVVGSLYERRRYGQAQAIELAQAEAMVSIMPEFLHADAAVHREQGNEDRRAHQVISTVDGVVRGVRGQGERAQTYSVRGPAALMEEPETQGLFESVDHPACGTHRYPGSPILIDGRRVPIDDHAPSRGQHTNQVLTNWLTMQEQELSGLVEADVISQQKYRERVH